MNAQELLTAIIAAGGCIGTIALLILNLRVSGAMADLRTDLARQWAETSVEMAKLQVQMAQARTDNANDRASIYEKIMDSMGRMYIPREAQLEMHKANVTRLEELKTEVNHINQRVADIG